MARDPLGIYTLGRESLIVTGVVSKIEGSLKGTSFDGETYFITGKDYKCYKLTTTDSETRIAPLCICKWED